MPAAHRLEDNDTGHDACPPTALSSASGDVFINGKGAGRVEDTYAPHGCKAHPCGGRRQREQHRLHQWAPRCSCKRPRHVRRFGSGGLIRCFHRRVTCS